MNILINGNKVDFEVESEKTLKDILHSLITFVKESNFIHESIEIDGKNFELLDEEYLNKPLEEILEISMLIVKASEKKYEKLRVLEQYMEIVANSMIEYLENPSDNAKMVVNANLKDISQVKKLFITIDDDWDLFNIDFLVDFKFDNLSNKILAIENIQKILSSRIAEIEYPVMYFKKSITSLHELMSSLSEITFLFQSGKDAKAISMVLKIANELKNLLRIFDYLEDDIKPKTHIDDIFTLLKEFNDAIKHEDTILLGDLLEYELYPKVEELYSILDTIK